MIVVRNWGIASSVQDAGRPGLAHLGRSRGGAVDRWSLALANRLVGNAEDETALETSGALTFTAERAVAIAITGAMVDVVVEDGPPVGWGMATALPAGATVRLGAVRDGLRTYVAVRGGLQLVHVALTGPSRSRGGDMNRLRIGADPRSLFSAEAVAPRPPERDIRVWPGPRLGWFVAGAWETLTGGEYGVSSDSNRVGARLSGPRLERSRHDELLSEGLVEGAIQVPPDGQPIVMLADHPTTGGYPVIAVVDPADLRHVVQAAPGTALRFRPIGRSALT